METQTKQQYTFFWGGIFSQWYPSDFTINGIQFSRAEQYMMYCKAMLFNDIDSAEKILQTKNPKEQKALGRKVQNFNKEVWEQHCKKFVYDASIAKFTQNPDLLKGLMDTGDTELVEASPEDAIWGIGLAAEDLRAQNKETWQGTNWLGEILTQVRQELRNKAIKPEVSFDDFMKADIRLCKILSVEKVEKTDKLYKLEIFTGIDKRIVVSAIAHKFSLEDLLDKTLPFILNLPVRKIAGIPSHGMIILAEDKTNNILYQLLTPNGSGEGSIVI